MNKQYNRRSILKGFGYSSWALMFGHRLNTLGGQSPQKRPNILWIIVEDMSCHFGYQSEQLVHTPNVDRFAAEGATFTNAYITCPVCSPSRSAMVTGMYQTTIGVHNHRSSRGKLKYHLPDKIRLVPEIFKRAGYFTCNCNANFNNFGKTDYNFVLNNRAIYDGHDWSGRKPGQPFFAQVHLHGGKYRNGRSSYARIQRELASLVRPDQVELPPYYPNHPLIRKDWAEYLDCVNYTDMEVGRILKRLKNEGLAENTVVIFITDHGISHARGKQFLYEEGVHIPFIVWAPGRVKSGTVRDDFAVHIDMAATSMYFAGIEIPEYMESRPLFGPDAKPREYAISARDRCDETVDRIRSVRKGNFKYIRNFYPRRPYLQPCAYKDNKEILKTIRKLYKEGKLNEVQTLHMANHRPPEELYELGADPWEIQNLANDPAYLNRLEEMREILENWIKQTNDKGQRPEPEEMYDSDMAVYVDGMKSQGRKGHAAVIEGNIRLMKKWRAEGK